MGQNKFEWPLINDNITEQDKQALIKWLQEPDEHRFYKNISQCNVRYMLVEKDRC